eukprot:TRINITY_DN13603_c0_g1_i1.p1 TRINITY_DN13603_c0_g1~~TRINITY_DN13603_c0_g1_i1.p1  ORF type:complete len:126 (-),score=30.77 TRINITY_DN13603_c0_g1_i1:57-434(-)
MWVRWICSLLLGAVVAASAAEADASHAAGYAKAEQVTMSALQMSSKYRLKIGTGARAGAGGTAGYRLHRRREKVHIWSKPCRHLPLLKRAACEREVDAQVLHDKSWVKLNEKVQASAFTVALDHD